MTDDEKFVKRVNGGLLPFMKMLGTQLQQVDSAAGTAETSFDVPRDFCHSGDIVQGGFVTAMLDASMSFATFAMQGWVGDLSSLELKVSFLEASRAGKMRCLGRVVRAGRSIVFLEGELYNAEGQLTATATSTAKLLRSAQHQ